MTSLRIILVALLAVGLTVLAVLNWQTISLNLGGGTSVDIMLPVFAAGLLALVAVPISLVGLARRKLLERKVAKLSAQLEKAEADLAQARIELLRPPAAAPAKAAAGADTRPAAAGPGAPLPPQAIPQAAPPPGI